MTGKLWSGVFGEICWNLKVNMHKIVVNTKIAYQAHTFKILTTKLWHK